MLLSAALANVITICFLPAVDFRVYRDDRRKMGFRLGFTRKEHVSKKCPWPS